MKKKSFDSLAFICIKSDNKLKRDNNYCGFELKLKNNSLFSEKSFGINYLKSIAKFMPGSLYFI